MRLLCSQESRDICYYQTANLTLISIFEISLGASKKIILVLISILYNCTFMSFWCAVIHSMLGYPTNTTQTEINVRLAA